MLVHRALQNLATLSNTYGAANCSLLKLYGSTTAAGGGSAASAALPAAAFQSCRHACLPKGGAGVSCPVPVYPHESYLAPKGVSGSSYFALVTVTVTVQLDPTVSTSHGSSMTCLQPVRILSQNTYLSRLWLCCCRSPHKLCSTSYYS